MGPNRPVNIVSIITILPKLVKPRVMPKLKPTVEKAAVVSKNMDKKSACSVIVSINELVNTNSAEAIAITTALNILSVGMRLPNISTSSFDAITVYITTIIRAKVEVFMPPPVEAGDDPMNIKIKEKYFAGFVKSCLCTVLKPAVLVDT